MSDRLVIHHGQCWDGFCAAWLIHRYLPGPTDFLPTQYGDPLPDVAGREVMVLDFSYPRDALERMASKAKSLVVLDHHRTAQADLKGLSYCTFDMDHSGGRLTWDWLVADGCLPFGESRPWLVDYTEDRDLWRWSLPSSREVSAALRSYPLDFRIWDGLAEDFDSPTAWDSLVGEGEAILRAERVTIDTHIARAHEIEMDGHQILSVNATTLFSEIAGELAKDRPFGAVWFERPGPAGMVRQWSLRSRDGGVDVSEIARAHGGGGHRAAAGFEESV